MNVAAWEHPPTRFVAQYVTDVASLAALMEDWRALADRAVEANAFYEPFALLPALEHLAAGDRVGCVLIWGEPGQPADPGVQEEKGVAQVHKTTSAEEVDRRAPRKPQPASRRALCGLFPVSLSRWWTSPSVGLWRHAYAYNCTPLVRRDCVTPTLAAFLDWSRERGIATLRWPELHAGGPLYRALWLLVQQRRSAYSIQTNYLRAEFRPAASIDAYLKRAMSTSTRKELLRLERRLAEVGRVDVDWIEPQAPLGSWLEDFLELEASGWKGRSGTALAAAPAARQYFLELAQGAHAQGRLCMLRLRLDGRPMAMNCCLRTADGGFYFKIAHDEAQQRYSPGRLLELAFLRRLHAEGEVDWIDSCASANHGMIERLWDGRRAYQSLWLATRPFAGPALVALWGAMGLGKSVWRSWTGR